MLFRIRKLLLPLLLLAPAVTFADLATLSLTGKCVDCDLSNQSYDLANFSGKKFYCSNFNNASFQNTSFANSIVAGKLTRTNMRGADMTAATLEVAANHNNCTPPPLGISLADMSITTTMLHGTLNEPMIDVESILFLDSDLRGSTMNGVTFISPKFKTNFKSSGVIGILATKLTGVRATGASTNGGLLFVKSDARKIDFSVLSYTGNIAPVKERFFVVHSNWAGANVSNSSLPLSLWSSTFTNANLSGSKVAHIVKSDLSNTNFQGSNLSGSQLHKSQFDGSDFSSASLYGANMSGSSFKGANFSGAILVGANLSNADFSNADFTGANLEDVTLKGANLCEATAPSGELLFIGC